MRISVRGLGSAAGNLLLAAFFAAFASAHVRAFLVLGRPSLLLMVGKESLDVVFYLTRPSASRFSRSPYAWLAGLGGTFTPLLLRPGDAVQDSPAGQLVLCAGLLLQFLGMLSLNRSIGIVPAHRGIKTGGLYRFVRHPLYLAYSVTHAGYLICNPSLHNAGVALATFLFQLLRIANEERFLRRDPEYVAFARRTRWALLPGVF